MNYSLRSTLQKSLHFTPCWFSHSVAGLLATVLAAALLTPAADANLNVTLNLDRYNGNFRGSVYLYANGSSTPITHHRVDSPNNIIHQTSDYSSSSSPNLSFPALIDECTNGVWTLTLNKDDPSEEQYAFSVSITGVASNMFGDTTITNPPNMAVASTNQPLIEWISTSLFPEVHIQVHNGFQPPEPGNWTNMVAPVNSFIPAPVLGGDNYIYLAYQTNSFGGIIISTPTNLVGGATVTNWNADGDLSSYDSSSFEAPGGSADPFDVAVESPGLSWSSYGDAGWFISSSDYSVGSTALESGDLLFSYGSSSIEAMAIGPGTVTFDWALFADYGDSFDFVAGADSYGGDYDYFYYEGNEAYGWDSYGVDLEPGTNWLIWTFNNDDLDENDLNAALLDNVEYTPEYEADLDLNIQCVVSGGASTYRVYPHINSGGAAVESPNGYSSGDESSASSAIYPTLAAAINECTNGLWTLSYDGGATFNFTIDVSSLDTNSLPAINITMPADGASGVSATTDYAWMGPTNYSSTYVSVYRIGDPTNSGAASLSGTATNWIGPTLNSGTNRFSVTQSLYSFGGVTISDPGIETWYGSTRLTSRATSDFVVGGIVPLPVTILPPVALGGNLGLSFISQSGTTHIVECTTNLVSGPWLPVTNFPGNGDPVFMLLPTTNPAAFYHVETQ